MGAPAPGVRRDDLLQLAMVLALAGLALTAFVAWHGSPVPGDTWVIRQTQEIGQLDRNAGIINRAADAIWVVVAVAVLLVLFRERLGIPRRHVPHKREALAALSAAVVLRLGGVLLKLIVEAPRPSAAFGVRIEEQFGGYSFPSGHVYSVTLFYGLLAVLGPAFVPGRFVLIVRVVCVAIIVLAAPARVAVGAHWPSDTLGGYLWGGAAMLVAAWFGRWVAAR